MSIVIIKDRKNYFKILNYQREVIFTTSIKLEDISMVYGVNGKSHTALSNVNLDIKNGEFISLIGPSGCGKSTIIDLISGIKVPTKGRIFIGDEPVIKPGPECGIVFQDYSLFPWMTAYENIFFAVEHANKNLSKEEVKKTAHTYLDLVGLCKFKDAYPGTLSGGMKQRVSIARMFAMHPKVFLMDEPFGALDSLNRIFMQDLLLHMWSEGESRNTVLFVTHDVDEALLLSDRIGIMSSTPGKIEEIIDIPFSRPRCRKSLSGTEDYIKLKQYLFSVLYCEMQEIIESQQAQKEAL